MNRCNTSIKCLFAIITIPFLFLSCSTAGGKAGPSEEKTDAMLYIEDLIKDNYSVGMAVAVITEEGVSFHNFGSLSKGGKPVNENTLFEIGSITKVFTAALLADFSLKGLVSYSDPLQEYLPVKDPSINLLHLATHHSGLPVIPLNLDAADPNPYGAYGEEALISFLSDYDLTRAPGELYEYSNLGSGALGYVLASLSGKTYEELVSDTITHPLGMADTVINLNKEQKARFAQGYLADGSPAPNWDFDALAGCGALRSTASDMARFIQANLGLMETALASLLKETHGKRAGTGQEGLDIGLGWHIVPLGDSSLIWHNGGTGGYRSFCGFIPEQKMGVVVLSNSVYDIDTLGFHLLVPQIPLPGIRKSVDIPEATLKSYVGSYSLAPGYTFYVTLEQGLLMVRLTGQPALAVFPETDTLFFYKDVDAQISFERDSEGVVKALILHQGGVSQRAEKIE